MVRQSNFSNPFTSQAAITITPTQYDKRALTCSDPLALTNSLFNLSYMTSVSTLRIAYVLASDGGLELIVRILKRLKGADTLSRCAFSAGLTCLSNVAIRGNQKLRRRLVEAGVVPVIIDLLVRVLRVLETIRLSDRREFEQTGGGAVALGVGPADQPADRQTRDEGQTRLRIRLDMRLDRGGAQVLRGDGPTGVMELGVVEDDLVGRLEPRDLEALVGAEQNQRINETGTTAPFAFGTDGARAVFPPNSPFQGAGLPPAALDTDERNGANGRMGGVNGWHTAPDPGAAGPMANADDMGMDVTMEEADNDTLSGLNNTEINGGERWMHIMQRHIGTTTAEMDHTSSTGGDGPNSRPGTPRRLDAMVGISGPAANAAELEGARFNDNGRQVNIGANDALGFAGEGGLVGPNPTSPTGARRPFMTPTVPPNLTPENPRTDVPSPFPLSPPPNDTDPAITGTPDLIYRVDDILLAIKLVAYLSKYHQIRSDLHSCYSQNVFELVEAFTTQSNLTEMRKWAVICMRNAFKRDGQHRSLRRCGNLKCGKIEDAPRQFSKCSRCRRVTYCSKTCQRIAWCLHKNWCLKCEGHGQTGTAAAQANQGPSEMESVAMAADGENDVIIVDD
ncbi:hypothetical protein HK104_010589 [Borealophlyctis nickersoniae]|nr:hypothetical protein HK104_010589 [Borealophlyctis nickersoniae]